MGWSVLFLVEIQLVSGSKMDREKYKKVVIFGRKGEREKGREGGGGGAFLLKKLQTIKRLKKQK